MESISKTETKQDIETSNTKLINKQLIILIVGALSFIMIHYILFNDFMNNIPYIDYFRTLFYGLFIVAIFIFLNFYNKQKLQKQKREYIKVIKHLEDENENYEKIITEFVKSRQNQELIQEPKNNIDLQNQEKDKEVEIKEPIKEVEESPEIKKEEKCEDEKCGAEEPIKV